VTANFSDPQFAFVWASYGLLALVVVGVVAIACARLSYWARRAKDADDPGQPQ